MKGDLNPQSSRKFLHLMESPALSISVHSWSSSEKQIPLTNFSQILTDSLFSSCMILLSVIKTKLGMNQQKPRASSLKSATMFHPLHFNLFFSEVKQDSFSLGRPHISSLCFPAPLSRSRGLLCVPISL